MARPGVADGGDGLQIWRVAANVLTKVVLVWGLGMLTRQACWELLHIASELAASCDSVRGGNLFTN